MNTESSPDGRIHTPRLVSRDILADTLDVSGPDPIDVVDGAPVVRDRTLATLPGVEIGLWEITPGTVRDSEIDEVFVVVSGSGTVAFDDGTILELAAGVAVRLRAGEQTIWTIHETLRKVYVAG